MKIRYVSPIAVLALALTGFTAKADVIQGEVLVHLKSGVDVAAFNQTFGTSTMLSSPYTNSYRLAAPAGIDVTALATQMTWDSRVTSAGPNLSNRSLADAPTDQFIFTADADQAQSTQFIFTADQFIFTADQFIFTADQFIFTADRNPGLFAYMTQSTSALIHYGSVSKQYRGTGVIIAVLDTGISTRNGLLAPHVLSGWNFVNGNSNTDDSPSGLDSNGNGNFDEDAGHGTMVAGLINRYAQGASLLPVKVLDSDGAGSLWATTEGIRYAMAHGAKIINMSFGSSQDSPLLQEAIRDAWAANVLIVASAGNSNTNVPQYPAGNSMSLSVGSLDAADIKASFSNYGSWMDVLAPGVGLPSTFWTGQYASWSGTSFSAPLVSAEAALLMGARPTWSAARVRTRIKTKADSVDALNSSLTGQLGKGIVDFDATLTGI